MLTQIYNQLVVPFDRIVILGTITAFIVLVSKISTRNERGGLDRLALKDGTP